MLRVGTFCPPPHGLSSFNERNIMIKDVTGQVVCQTCKAHFPKSWIRDQKSDACTSGMFAFCSRKCRLVFDVSLLRIGKQIPLALDTQ